MESFSATNIDKMTTHSAQEDLYQVLAHPEGSTQPFALMVRLTPEIIEKLKHAEEEGAVLRMKFGNDVSGNVIEVGLEAFKFSLATEPGDVSYIYAENSDENGTHILREVGSTRHNLSVLSYRDKEQHTAEAEKHQKLQKSVSVFQNPHLSIPQVAITGVPSVHEHFYATDQVQNLDVSAPAAVLPELMGGVKETPEAHLMALPHWKDELLHGEGASEPLYMARNTEEKALATTMSAKSKINITGVRNLLISLLQETPKGMTIKALEKAVIEKLAVNPERKWIEKIIKSIATFHAPGKYILNPGVEKGPCVDVSIGNSGKSNETSRVETLERKPLTGLILEAISQKELGLDLQKASQNKSHDSPANKHRSSQPVSHITYGYTGKSPRLAAVEDKLIGSCDSDSSSTNGGKSESGTSSKGSATSASESSSGSESDASSSNSEPNMDEDVDIMSDGEDKTRLDLSRPKLKEDDLELPGKQDSKLQDDFEKTEGIDSVTFEKHNASSAIQSNSPGNISPTLEDMKVKKRECMADNLLETIFGPDKDAVDTVDSGVSLRVNNLKDSLISSTLRNEAAWAVPSFSQMHSEKQVDTFSETSERRQEQGHSKQEQRKRTGSDRSTSLGPMETRAEKRVKHLDNLVGKTSEDKDTGSTSSWCDKSDAHPTYHQSSLFKVSEIIEKKDAEHLLTKQETRIPIEKANFNVKADNSSFKNSSLSLEVSKENFVGSSLKEKDRLQKVGRPSREANSVNKLQSKQHYSIKPDKMTTTNKRTKHGEGDNKHDASQARNSQCDERVVPKMISINSKPGDTSRFARSLPNRSKELPGKNDCSHSKKEVSKSSMPKLTDSRETITRRRKVLKAQTCPQKDSGTNKPTTAGFNRELGNVHHALELGGISKDTQKTSQPNSLELPERIGSFEKQVKRPKKGAELSNQGRKSKIEDDLKDADLKGRASKDEMLSTVASKERIRETAKLDSGHSSRSAHAFSRNSFHESKRYDSQGLEPREYREPASENEQGGLSLKRERHCFEATSRVTSESISVTPDSQKPLLLCRSKLEASPAQGENNFLQDLGSQKMILQVPQRAAPYRPIKKNQGTHQSKQKLGADHRVKQSQHERSASITNDLGGSTRSGASDSVTHTAGSKETSKKHCNKLLERSNPSAFCQQETNNVLHIPKKKSLREDRRVRDSRVSCKKQTLQSSDVLGDEFFALYEKEEPELRGTIYSFEQFRDYYQEFNEKYPVYTQLNTSLEHDKENFEMFRKDFEEAERRGDMAKLAKIYALVKKEYSQCRKRSKRMRHTFKVLHEELQGLINRLFSCADAIGYQKAM